MPPFDLRWLRPLGLVGALIAIIGGVLTDIAARHADWPLVPVRMLVVGVGALIVVRGRRRTED